MADIAISFDLQAPDEASARAKAKDLLDAQIAALNCPPPPQPIVETVTTSRTVTDERTVTTPVTVKQPTIVQVPGPTQVVTTEKAVADKAPIVVKVTVREPNPRPVVWLNGARCYLSGERVPCALIRNGKPHKVTVSGVWLGDTLSVTKITG